MPNNQFINFMLCRVKTGNENIIIRYIRTKHINKSKLAERIGMSHQNLQGRLAKNSLPTDFVEQLSDALEHDFFADLSKEYQRKHFDVSNVVEQPVVKYGSGSLDAMIENIVERKINERLNRK